jgi:hypothetical protein
MTTDETRSATKKNEYPIFICHEQITGRDFAEYLRDGFRRKKGISCFAFEFDMPKTITRQAVEWETIIDNAIATSHTFFLLLTNDQLTEQVVREFKQAMDRLRRDPTYSIAIFRHKSVSRTSDDILSVTKIDTSKLNQIDFDSKEDLVRHALNIVDDSGFAKTFAVQPPYSEVRAKTVREQWQEISVNVRLPVTRWGQREPEKSTISIHIGINNPVGDLVQAGLKAAAPLGIQGPWYLVFGNRILGPENYSSPIQTSGIQNNQTVFLTNDPSPETSRMIPRQPDMPTPYAEPKILYSEEIKAIARIWVQGQLPALQLREWSEFVNKGDRVTQVRGVVKDQYTLPHEYDVRVSKEDGTVVDGSYVR